MDTDGLLRSEYEALLDNFYNAIPADIRARLESQYGGGEKSESNRALIVEEYLAYLGETNPQHHLWQRFVYEFKRLLARFFGDSIKFTEADIRQFVAKVVQARMRGRATANEIGTRTVRWSKENEAKSDSADADLATQSSGAEADKAFSERRRGMAGALAIGGIVFVDRSTGAGGGTLHPFVQELYDKAPLAERSDYHGKYAEGRCISKALYANVPSISKALYANVPIKGAVFVATKIGGPKHGRTFKACKSCKPLLIFFKIVNKGEYEP